MKIAIHLINGNVVQFEQEDAKEAATLLDRLHPDRVFNQPVVIIAGAKSLTSFPTSSIVYIDVQMPVEPGWPFHFNAKDAVVIDEAEFNDWHSREPEWATRLMPTVPGDLYVSYGRVELSNGENLYMEVKVEADLRMPFDRGLMIRNLFSAHHLHARRREGGSIIINPQQIVRMTMFPGPSETPPHSWPGHHVSG